MRILCFGDSNTWGFDPRSFLGSRYPAPNRWPDIIREKSGIILENWGENGREIPKNGWRIPLNPTDILIIMLGTNNLLQGYTAEEATQSMAHFLKTVPLPSSQILLVAPPGLQPGAWITEKSVLTESAAFAEHLRKLSHTYGTHYLNADEWIIPLTYDGVHFTEEGHIRFAHHLYSYLSALHVNF